MTTLKFTRRTAGHYTAITPQGTIEIKKGMGVDAGKWYVYFPCGKTSYRRSYDAAKTWANNYYLDKQPKQPTVTATPKKKTESSPTPKPTTQPLKAKLNQPNAYVIGADYLGCVNTGRSACIIHIVVENKSYYLVGFDGAIMDTCFQRTVTTVKRQLAEDPSVKFYSHGTFGEVKIYTSFNQAEKEYDRINKAVKSANANDFTVISEARERIKSGTATTKDYFTLSDYGVI